MRPLSRFISFVVIIGFLVGSIPSLMPDSHAVAESAVSNPRPVESATLPAVSEWPDEILSKIEPFVLKSLKEESARTDVFLWLTEKADLSPAYRLKTKEEKGRFVFETLRATAERTQRELRAYLDRLQVRYQPFYISNKILVRDADQRLLYSLAARPDVARITANHRYQLEKPRINPKPVERVTAVEPNISFVNADDVWALGVTGEGIVLAGNDTGLDWQHPAILPHYRGWNGSEADHNYNWWDATDTSPTAPRDVFGHGTHTTGTMVGDDGGTNQIGMAPGAQTIHCKNMDDSGGGWDATFIECFQWDLAPWDLSGQNPRPELAPDAVNNSWGYWGGGVPQFEDEIAALQAAGILVEVSAGNEGPSCRTLRSPGDYGEVLTTGSVSHASGTLPGSLTWFSSRGPSSLSPDYIPDVMAPGENVRSAVPGGRYENWDGTSMAGPHVTGLIGLIWSANPALRGLVPETQQIIWSTAEPLTGQTGSHCGGDYVEGPNQDWGYGTIDALAAVEAAMRFGGVGTLAGTVTDSSSGDPLADVLIWASLTPELTWKMKTNEQGQYSRLVFSGTYTVSAELYGYYPALITGVQVISGTTTTLDIAMDPAPFYTVTGQVIDADAGWPLYARLDIAGYPGGPVWTDPETGQYRIRLAAGIPYTFKVSSWVEGYEPISRAVGPLTGDQVEDFAIHADRVACAAPGYRPQFAYFEDFEGDDGGYTVEGYTTSWQWGSPTSGPRRAHSGSSVWATNLTGNYYDGEYGSVSSPDIDLSGILTGGDQFLVVTWWQYLETEQSFDFAWVEVSNDGGSTWTTVYGPESGPIDLAWTKHTVYLDSSYAVANFRIRFGFQSDLSVNAPGYYVDDVGIGVTAAPPNLYAEDFEADNGGYTVQGVTSWEWGTPTRGPSGAHSGEKAWGTNLSGNYGNNEDGTLTSPPIDLSGGAQGAESLQLSWWQWLQTESGYDWASVEVSDGLGWTEIISVSGVQNTEWTRNVVYLDPARYAVPNFQIRFRLRSDETVTYPGFYVDDVRVDLYTPTPPAVPCELESGGLVFGHVYAASTGEALNGATVASRQMVTLSQATPEDEALNDGFYTLFAEPGLQVITATMSGGYGPEAQVPTVIPGSAVRQDFHLPSGWLAAEPPALQTMLEMGYSTTLTFTLQNGGALPAFFELKEQAGEFTPAKLEAVDVPGYQVPATPEGVEKSYAGRAADHLVSRAPGRYQPPAEAVFSSAGVTVLLVAAADVTQIQALLQAYPDLPVVDVFDARMGTPTLDQLRAYDAVVLISNFPFADPVAMGDVLADYVDAGGAVVQTVPTFYDPGGNGWGLQGRFVAEGYSPFIGTGDWFTWADLGDFDPAHPIMEGVGSAGDYYRQMVDLAPEAEWVASWTDDEFVATKDAVVALNTFLSDGYAWTGDIPLIVHNSLIWLQSAGDVPWLSLAPITGTVESLNSQPIQVTFDAGVPEIVQPGQYTAQIRIKDDTPHQADPVPVTMTVGAPAGWGKLTGAITGLERCDAPGGPLPAATVDIQGVTSLQPDGEGIYGYWLPAGPYTVTVSAPGYVSQTFMASILAGQTITRDVSLRLDAPCTSPPAAALSVTLFQGWTMTEPLTLENSGAADLSFVFFESPFSLGAMAGPAPLRAGPQAFRLSPRQGPASVVSLAAAERVSPAAGETPLSGWFGGLDVPGGLVRYGFAQCPEYPDQYYVLSGVDANLSVTKKAWRYDAATNEWTELASLPGGGEAPAAVCYQGRIYVMGGSGTDQFYVYDIATDRWTALAALPRGVEGAAAAAWNGKVYLVGGDDDFTPSTGVSDRVDIYDIATDAWIGTGAPMPIGVGNAGWVQVGPVLYVVGGWGVDAPASNVRATLRYDLETDTWELGPEFSGRADLALAATAQALYAMGGDKDGGEFFDAVRLVERLDLSAWPDGVWTDMGDPLPIGLSANNAGFCTRILMDGDVAEVWSVGGGDVAGAITGRTLFREMPGESCPSIYLDVPWLSVEPPFGTVPISGSLPVTVLLDAGGLMTGTYTMTLVLHTNDPGYYLIHIPVTMRVVPLRTYYLPLVTKGFGP